MLSGAYVQCSVQVNIPVYHCVHNTFFHRQKLVKTRTKTPLYVLICNSLCYNLLPTRVSVTEVSVLKDYQVTQCEHHNRLTNEKYRNSGWFSNLKIDKCFL